ncbi:methylaspartate mutase subunit E [Thermodesulfobacteriota bacterium]
MEIRNIRIDDERFQKERKEVLDMYHTGKEVDLDEAISFHKSMPPNKNYGKKLARAKETKETLIRSDSGVPDLDEHCEYLRYLQEEGRTDLLGTLLDSMTRNFRFDEAEKGLQESVRTGNWLLNGFPLLIHGVTGARKVIEAVDLPVEIRGVAPDWRLMAEIGFAGGHTATSSNPLQAFSHFSKNIPQEVVIKNSQYMYRLMGYYEENGVSLSASITGGFGILCPFSVLISGAIIDSIIAAEQGVRQMCLTVHTQGNIVQDVAAIKTLRKMAEEYLRKLGYDSIVVTINCTNWSGKFPEDVFQASAVICIGVMAAVLANGEIAHVKTIEEAKTIPTREANAATLRLGKTMITMLQDQKPELDWKAVEIEAKMLEMEVKSIVDRVLELGDGDSVVGNIKAVEAGIIDFPFPISRHIPAIIKGVRDKEGMVRYLDHGNLPFTKEIIEFHKEKIKERERSQERKVDYQSVIDDLSSISKGLLVSRPL